MYYNFYSIFFYEAIYYVLIAWKARGIEIKNKLTVTRGEVGGDNGGKEGMVFGNIYRGHMDKTQSGVGSRVRGGDEWGAGSGGGKMETIILEQQ